MLNMQHSSHKTTLIIIGIIVLLGGVIYYFVTSGAPQTSEPVDDQTTETTTDSTITVTYQCDKGRSIVATYHEGLEPPAVEPGEVPVPTGSVDVVLDGDDAFTLNQTISASGIRYANGDESLVFWSKGDSALIMRDNSMDLTYTNCMEV